MKSIKKILITSCLFLVILANFSYAVTYNLCMMTSKPKCACEERSITAKGNSVKTSSCCKSETKEITNSSNLYKLSDVQGNLMMQAVFSVSNLNFSDLRQKILPSYSSLFEEISPTQDIPINNSVLII